MNPPNPARKHDHSSSRPAHANENRDSTWEGLHHVRESLREIFEALGYPTKSID